MRAVIIGLGGIGSNLAEPLCRMLAHLNKDHFTGQVVLIDGKAYREHNTERQRAISFANKAEVTCSWLTDLFPNLAIEPKPVFVNDDNIFGLIFEGDIIFMGCDNHATRKIVSDYTTTLENAFLISGGNELFDGNVQVFWRKDGKNMTQPLTWHHPEIDKPQGRNPSELSCEELAQKGELQLLAVNMMVVALMLNVFTLYWLKEDMPYNEIYFDIQSGNVRPIRDGVAKT